MKKILFFIMMFIIIACSKGDSSNMSGIYKGATIKTNMGSIEIEFFPKEAPLTVENFIAYAESGYYSGTIFHRVIKGFMIQGGGFTAKFDQKGTNSPVKNEADNGLKNDRGTVAMARTNIVDSATSQFFINHKNNDFLNHQNKTPQGYGYAVFARVTKGMDVVDAIADIPTGRMGPFSDVPQKPVIIESVELIKK